MRSKFWFRNVAVVLVGLNLLLGLWDNGGLRLLGLGPKPVQEPSRLENQIAPDLLVVKTTKPDNK
ncbi:hypothetical protein [Limnohabitans sp. B9-3]|uniref:hypothetical protein n=1 Tax=Limnohabitans sp. B9-3 TaxID=1100707 RepID=UPI000C1E6FF3|nr:hypothetical protein [Limnohabitans sp. B9-3]PIT72929.1 hypothetical protein B9Z42_11480 [Limnohabitans sp. B9-3]